MLRKLRDQRISWKYAVQWPDLRHSANHGIYSVIYSNINIICTCMLYNPNNIPYNTNASVIINIFHRFIYATRIIVNRIFADYIQLACSIGCLTRLYHNNNSVSIVSRKWNVNARLASHDDERRDWFSFLYSWAGKLRAVACQTSYLM